MADAKKADQNKNAEAAADKDRKKVRTLEERFDDLVDRLRSQIGLDMGKK